MGIISGFMAIWKLVALVRAEKKRLEANTDAYLSKSRAMIWRLNAEKIFRALENGDGKFADLPSPVKWFFKSTTADNRVGKFGQWFLKSEKLETGDSVLNQPLYQTRQATEKVQGKKENSN